MSTPNVHDTIIAQATAPGRAAIAVIRLSGSESIPIVNEAFPTKNLNDQSGYTLHFGKIVNEENKVLDEVLVSVFKSPHSYTGEDSIEVSCHGSPLIVQELIQSLINRGARPAGPGEFSMRAFLNGKLDLSQAEAVADLIAAESTVSRDIALKQLRGGVTTDLQRLREKLIKFASLIELELDFSEEDVAFANRDELADLIRNLLEKIEKLTDSFKLGNAIKNGITTVIAGRPNAGKSTLLNAMLNEERAIVSDVPGTTRDTIEEVLQIEGIPFRLIDTAGIREAQDAIEEVGVARTLSKVSEAALLLYVFDVTKLKADQVREDVSKLWREDLPILIVANKMDRNPYAKVTDYIKEDNELQLDVSQFIPVSAINKMNIPYLKEKIYNIASINEINIDVPLTNSRHYASLLSAQDDLNRALHGLESGLSGDLLAVDIRQALNHLGEITGEVSTDDLLERIFSDFCIGK